MTATDHPVVLASDDSMQGFFLECHAKLSSDIAKLEQADQLMLRLLMVENLDDASAAEILDVSRDDIEEASVRVLKILKIL